MFWSFFSSCAVVAYNMLKLACLQHLNICILLKGSCFRNDLYLIIPKATSFTISFMRYVARLIALEQFSRVYMILSKSCWNFYCIDTADFFKRRRTARRSYLCALYSFFWTQYWYWLRVLSIDTNTYAVDSRLSWLNGDNETVLKIGFKFRIKFYLFPRALSKCLGRGMKSL